MRVIALHRVCVVKSNDSRKAPINEAQEEDLKGSFIQKEGRTAIPIIAILPTKSSFLLVKPNVPEVPSPSCFWS